MSAAVTIGFFAGFSPTRIAWNLLLHLFKLIVVTTMAASRSPMVTSTMHGDAPFLAHAQEEVAVSAVREEREGCVPMFIAIVVFSTDTNSFLMS